MATALSTVTLRNTLPAADTKTDTLVRTFANRLEDGSDWRRRALPDRLAPTEGERAVLAERVNVIDRWLAPSRKAFIIRAVGLCRSAMASAASPDGIEDVYAQVLAPYPEPVIEDVCNGFLTGRLGNRVYAPTPAEIAHECRLAVADALAERGRIMLVLDAEVYRTPTAEEQAKIQAEHQRFVDDTAKTAKARLLSGTLKPAGSDAAARRDAIEKLKTWKRVEIEPQASTPQPATEGKAA